jgi:hypothetical protein
MDLDIATRVSLSGPPERRAASSSARCGLWRRLLKLPASVGIVARREGLSDRDRSPVAALSSGKGALDSSAIRLTDPASTGDRSRSGWLRLRRAAFATLGLAAALVLAGCREEVHVYTVPKETNAPALPAGHPAIPGHPAVPGHPAPPSGARPAVAWTVPAGWTDKGASGMRAGSFVITNASGQMADISVIPMQSWAGQELDNVNRWRAQVGQPPLTPEELPRNTAAIPFGEAQGQLFEMASPPSAAAAQPKRVLSAVLVRPDTVWYVKMTGDDALVRERKPEFLAFAKSFSFPAAQ